MSGVSLLLEAKRTWVGYAGISHPAAGDYDRYHHHAHPFHRQNRARQAELSIPLMAATAMGACPLLAQSGHFVAEFQCPLLGVKRTSQIQAAMSANDPKRT